jgi:DNA-directed RNA polymerase subunit M/transcription elongation factor TFIIS
MAVVFCPRCGNLAKGMMKGGKRYGYCPKCNFTFEVPEGAFKELRKVSHQERGPIHGEEPSSTHAEGTSLVKCPECGGRAVEICSYTPWGDESTVYIFKCTKCGKVFRHEWWG